MDIISYVANYTAINLDFYLSRYTYSYMIAIQLPIVPLQIIIMNIDITEDLKIFKSELIAELKELLQPQQHAKMWLRSSEVRKMLSISPGTLQNLRVNGTLRFQKVGGTMFYKADDINQMLGEKPSKRGAL